MNSSILQYIGKTPVPETRCQHYYIKDYLGNMLGCVAIAPMDLVRPDSGRICRGISLCSDEEKWDRKKARRIAIARVRKAVGMRKSCEPIHNCDRLSVDSFYESDISAEFYDETNIELPVIPVIYKVGFNVVPLHRELGILYHLVKRLGGDPISYA